jgi:lambda family phage minor tail protein L
MTVYADMQKLEAGAEIVLYVLDATEIGGGTERFHGYQQIGDLVWQGNTYSPYAITATGFGRTADKPPSPRVAVGNVDGSISALCMLYQDLVGARLIVKRTFAKYLDAVNYPGGINPTANPDDHFPDELWFVERKASENNREVVFELSSGMDISGVGLPGRQIIANFCPWIVIGGYRGPYCGYDGPAVAKADDTPTADLLLDRCGGRLTSCKLRFGENGKLPIGAMPAAGLVRT